MRTWAPSTLLALLWLVPATGPGEASGIQKLFGSQPGIGTGFGEEIDCDGRVAVIGKSEFNGPRVAYVFERSPTGWLETAALTQLATFFPSAVAVDRGIVLVGGRGTAVDGVGAGVVYAYTRDATGSWSFDSRLVPSSPSQNQQFGASARVVGGRAFVGAPNEPDLLDDPVGAVHVFQRSGPGHWAPEQVLVPSDGASYDRFGSSLDAQPGRIVVGAPQKRTSTGEGIVYVFESTGGPWTETARIEPQVGPFASFATSLALDGDTLAVSAPSDPAPAVRIFELTGGSWRQTAVLTPVHPGPPFYGFGLDLREDRLLVGHSGTASPFATFGGVVQAYVRTSAGWILTEVFQPPDNVPGDVFGVAICQFADGALIGASGDDTQASFAGAVYALTWPATSR